MDQLGHMLYCHNLRSGSYYPLTREILRARAVVNTRKLDLFVDNWSCWQPQPDGSAVCFTAQGAKHTTEQDANPNLQAIAPMLRRRLSPLARVVFHVLGPQEQAEPVIFSSLMGEIQRTQGILESIAEDKPVSPTAFSLSVHNAIGGLWSLIHGVTAPMVALSPRGQSLVAALLEATGLLQERRYPSVNVVFYEDIFPTFYDPYLQSSDAPCALALRLSNDGGGAGGFRLSMATQPLTGEAVEGPLALLPLLTGETNRLLLSDDSQQWLLTHASN